MGDITDKLNIDIKLDWDQENLLQRFYLAAWQRRGYLPDNVEKIMLHTGSYGKMRRNRFERILNSLRPILHTEVDGSLYIPGEPEEWTEANENFMKRHPKRK